MNQPTTLRDASSTDCITSDDGTGAEAITSGSLNRHFHSGQADHHSRNEDDESLLVQESVASSSNSPKGNPNLLSNVTKDKKTHVFRRLSKSASRLLSQNKQTLSEMLNVEGKGEDVNLRVNMELGNSSRVEDMTTTPGSDENKETSVYSSAQSMQQLEIESQYLNKIHDLEEKLKNVEKELEFERKNRRGELHHNNPRKSANGMEKQCPLSNDIICGLRSDEVSRYSRQLLLSDGFGVEGQRRLLNSSVLVVGAGGIGSTLLLYLASSGVGRITVVDFDKVEMTNLHRQVIHTNNNVGMNKALSACKAITALNPTIKCSSIQEPITFENAISIVSRHDCVVDASDNPQTRYLINDACILSRKPLISGSAMGTEGQLTIYGDKDGGCYRCLYPKPNAAEGCKSCSDNGVLGPVPGLIGVLQAIETLKILTGMGSTMHSRLLMYDSLNCSFMTVKKPSRRIDCKVCGTEPSIKSMEDSKAASKLLRGPQLNQKTAQLPTNLSSENEISCRIYNTVRKEGQPHILLDVRVPHQFQICSIDGAVNIPLESVQDRYKEIERMANNMPVYCICRRGIASAEATRILIEKRMTKVYNVKGGYQAWSKEVDSNFPTY